MKRTKRINWTQIVNALVLVKIGQDLGTHCQLTQSVHDVIDTLAAFLAALSKFI